MENKKIFADLMKKKKKSIKLIPVFAVLLRKPNGVRLTRGCTICTHDTRIIVVYVLKKTGEKKFLLAR